MNTGMLWFDNDKLTDLATKIERAAAYYVKKYGTQPDLCFVHPSMLAGAASPARGIEVKTTQQILPNHFWIGVHESSAVGHRSTAG